MKGMANVSLPLNRIADVMVTVPSIEKQIEIIELEKRLVERELEVDELFADQLTQLGNLNLAILKEAVQGRLVNQDPKVEPASELLKRIKSEKATLRQAQGKGKKEKTLPPIKTEEIPFEIPESWVWCRFQEITHLITCGLASTPKYYPSGRIFLSAKNVKPFRFIPYEFKYVDEETYRKVTQNAKPELEDILITRVGAGIGETAVIDKEIDFAFYVSLTLVKPVKIGINSSYLSYWLNSTFGIQNAIEHTSGKGSNQGNLNVNRVRTFMIPLPPLSEQKRIVAEIEKQFAKTKQLKEHILANQQDTEQLLKALLHQAFEVRESETV
jgi:type I restriction enzyme S subunit